MVRGKSATTESCEIGEGKRTSKVAKEKFLRVEGNIADEVSCAQQVSPATRSRRTNSCRSLKRKLNFEADEEASSEDTTCSTSERDFFSTSLDKASDFADNGFVS